MANESCLVTIYNTLLGLIINLTMALTNRFNFDEYIAALGSPCL